MTALASRRLLEVDRLSKRFGGVQAVDGLQLRVNEGECLAIIGPNGAGKTTLFNLLTGLLRADSGRILYGDRDITRKKPHLRAKLGIARTFQVTSIFRSASVLENVLIGVQCPLRPWNPFGPAFSDPERIAAEAEHLVKTLGLGERAHDKVLNLSYGDQRLVEIALALSTRPRLLLLDEPTAGLSPTETIAFAERIHDLRENHDLTVVIIEHDMDLVMNIATRIAVLHFGRCLVEGRPEDVMTNEEVRRIYLEGEHRASN